ncbi:Thg1 C terminal domain-containing protein [Hygrophoropsis aurantiaca]|uniref:Thg1 C terminal domain-containing protein n=1 Tax=Hygrophoropsis aurantiaca TaxID=72124 RepID=A0ACB8AE22_9AGAM|nr:Thg1 C terminal domain-containing protein [Hygrophoropsis aurantiaca]
MAGSKFAYVKGFEIPDPLLPETFLVCRLDGHAFHRFSDQHDFVKPNDERALKLMDHVAKNLMSEYKDIVLGFGESDEFSFLLKKSTKLYNRRHAKILTTLTSYFTSCYVFLWSQYFPDTPLRYPPSFDGRIVVYPNERIIRDYFSWRQADTHINNLYNTVFWALVQQGKQSTTEAHATLKGTVSATKHEILHSRFGINYNHLNERFRKGSVIVREELSPDSSLTHTETTKTLADGCSDVEATNDPPVVKKKSTFKTMINILHCDIIGDEFWNARPYILSQ